MPAALHLSTEDPSILYPWAYLPLSEIAECREKALEGLVHGFMHVSTWMALAYIGVDRVLQGARAHQGMTRSKTSTMQTPTAMSVMRA